MSGVAVGLMGKHPDYGDFLQAGVDEPLVAALNGWLDASLPPLRDQLGEVWGPFWDAAPDLRFWVGRAVLGRSIFGVLHPSRDRVGRRFPLLLLVTGAAVQVPLGDEIDHSPWEQLEAHLDEMTPGQGAAALLEGAAFNFQPEDETAMATGPTIWAHHPLGDLNALLASAIEPDGDRARLTRSYWWTPGERSKDVNRAATWLGCAGLPDTQALGWLLGGIPAHKEDAT